MRPHRDDQGHPEGRLADIPTALPHTHRPLIANALLNRSVSHILAEERSAAIASILQRLVALILVGDRPVGGDGSSTAVIADPERGKLPASLDGARASRPAANERYIGNEEPSIEELLTDPIAALLRCRDGLSLDDVCRCIAETTAWIRFRAEGTSSPHCHKT